MRSQLAHVKPASALAAETDTVRARGTIWQRIVLPFGLYLALAVILTFPMALHLDQIAGSQIARADAWEKVYFFWWARFALEHRTNPLVDWLIYAPRGVPVAIEPLMLPLSLATLPLQYLFGPVVAYNTASLVTLALNGLSAALLARRWTPDRLAAFVAGALFLASPLALAVIWHGQLEKAVWFGSVLLLLQLLELARSTTRRRSAALIAGAALTLVGIAFLGMYVFLFTCIFCAIFSIGLLAARWASWTAIVPRFAAAVVLAAVPLILIFAPYIEAGPSNDTTWTAISRRQGADLLDLFLPFFVQPGRSGAVGFGAWPRTWNWTLPAGYTLLALALLGIIRAGRRARLWLALAGAAYLVGMGASLRVAGIDTAIPLPYRLVDRLPGINVSRYPELSVIFTHLLLAVAAAYGFSSLAQHRFARRRALLAALVCLAIVAEYGGWDMRPQTVAISPVFDALARLPARGSVFPLPQNNDVSNNEVYQIHHQKPIWGGHIGRTPDTPEVTYIPILRQLWRSRAEPPDLIRYTAEDLQTMLRFYNVGYVVFDKQQLDQRQYQTLQAIWRAVSGAAPILADQTTEVYSVPDPQQPRVQAALLQGWWEMEGGARWMSQAATLRLLNPRATTVPVRLHITVAQALAGAVDIRWDGAPLQSGVPLQSGAALEIALDVPPGEHEIRLAAPTAPRAVLGVSRQVSINVARIALSQ